MTSALLAKTLVVGLVGYGLWPSRHLRGEKAPGGPQGQPTFQKGRQHKGPRGL
ncbi:hypothetical protein [Meiothermus luteus]|uniref:hypothetical protein n=1 Tax=Meiothermus luteus TaxID=2026184 RepID=UPI001FE2FF55|nr:hypothetical protein [Meiothermus luteus]